MIENWLLTDILARKLIWIQKMITISVLKKETINRCHVCKRIFGLCGLSAQILFLLWNLIFQYTLNKCIDWAVISISAISSIPSIATVTWKVETFILEQNKQENRVSMHVWYQSNLLSRMPEEHQKLIYLDEFVKE